MANEQPERLEFFRAFVKAAEGGAATPPVTEDDLRLLHEVSADLASRRVGKDGMVSVDLMARICSLGANLPAVWLRYTQLRLLINQGILAEWQHREGWDDAVYRVAASIPMSGVQLDQRRSFNASSTKPLPESAARACRELLTIAVKNRRSVRNSTHPHWHR